MHCYILSLTKAINVFRLGNKEKKIHTVGTVSKFNDLTINFDFYCAYWSTNSRLYFLRVSYTFELSMYMLSVFLMMYVLFFRICIEYCISCLRDVYERRRVAWVEITLTGLNHQMFVSVSCQDAYFHKILSFLCFFFKSKIKQEEFEDTKGGIRIR